MRRLPRVEVLVRDCVPAHLTRLRAADPAGAVIVAAGASGRLTVLLRTTRFGTERAGGCRPEDLDLLLDASITNLLARFSAPESTSPGS